MATSTAPKPSILERIQAQGDIVTAVSLMAFMGIMVVPLPALAMDMFLAISVTVSLLILLILKSSSRHHLN